MKKTELLLKVAIAATAWGEGADFDMSELIHEHNYTKDVEEHYGVIYRMDEEEPEAWEKALYQVRRDTIAHLRMLLDAYLSAEQK